MSRSIGVIGVGELGRAIVEGLSAVDGEQPEIWLSPRGRAESTELARRYGGVHVCNDNREVSERASTLLLTVRADALSDAVADLSLSSESVVISAVAGVGHSQLQELLGDACTIVRAIPLPAVRTRASVTVVFPPDQTAVALFDQLGGSLKVADDATFAALSASTATVSTYLQYMTTVVGWLAAQGVDPGQADRYVRGFFDGASAALGDPSRSIQEIAADHETPGGLNEQVRRTWFDGPGLERTLDAIVERVTRN